MRKEIKYIEEYLKNLMGSNRNIFLNSELFRHETSSNAQDKTVRKKSEMPSSYLYQEPKKQSASFYQGRTRREKLWEGYIRLRLVLWILFVVCHLLSAQQSTAKKNKKNMDSWRIRIDNLQHKYIRSPAQVGWMCPRNTEELG